MSAVRNNLAFIQLLAAAAVLGFAVPAHAQQACIAASSVGGINIRCLASGSPAANQYNASQTTYFFDKGLNFNCGGICVIDKGSAFCSGIAKLEKQEGTYGCVKTCTGKSLSETAAIAGQACPVGEFCCQVSAGASAASAAGKPKTLPDPLGGVNITIIIGSVIRAFAGIAGSIALVMFVWGGISMILSKGESGRVEKAKQTLVNSAIGIVLIFGAFTFVSAIIDAILARTSGQ
jgi:hypothetical protein